MRFQAVALTLLLGYSTTSTAGSFIEQNAFRSSRRLAARDAGSTATDSQTTSLAETFAGTSQATTLASTSSAPNGVTAQTASVVTLSTLMSSSSSTATLQTLASSSSNVPQSLVTLTATAVVTVAGVSLDSGIISPLPMPASSSVLGLVPNAGITSSGSGNGAASSSFNLATSTSIGGPSGSQTGPPASATYNVEVGADGQLVFAPNSVNAAVGSVVSLIFRGLNHTMTESSLEQPCLSAHQFDSGFTLYNSADTEDMKISFTVNSPDPRWFFCRQTDDVNHCQRGMVFAINPGINMDNFIANAVGSATDTSSTTSTSPSLTPTDANSGASTSTQSVVLASTTAALASTFKVSTAVLTIATTASSLLLSSTPLSGLSSTKSSTSLATSMTPASGATVLASSVTSSAPASTPSSTLSSVLLQAPTSMKSSISTAMSPSSTSSVITATSSVPAPQLVSIVTLFTSIIAGSSPSLTSTIMLNPMGSSTTMASTNGAPFARSLPARTGPQARDDTATSLLPALTPACTATARPCVVNGQHFDFVGPFLKLDGISYNVNLDGSCQTNPNPSFSSYEIIPPPTDVATLQQCAPFDPITCTFFDSTGAAQTFVEGPGAFDGSRVASLACALQ